MTTDRIQCQVCQYAHIPRDMETCPQCDADLACFRLLDRLSDMPLEPAPVSPEAAPEDRSAFKEISDGRKTAALKSNDLSGSHRWLVPLALMALTLVLAGFFIFLTYRLSAVEHLLQRQHTVLMDLVTSNPMPDAKRHVPVRVAIKPVLILPKSLKESWKTDEIRNVIGIDME